MILFLDDSDARAAVFYQKMSVEDRNNTIWTKTAEEAISVLKDYYDQLTKVYLDHDLGGEQFVDWRREDCGMEVIRYLENNQKPEFKTIKWIVHSWNGPAGMRMVERLNKLGYNAIYKPFGT